MRRPSSADPAMVKWCFNILQTLPEAMLSESTISWMVIRASLPITAFKWLAIYSPVCFCFLSSFCFVLSCFYTLGAFGCEITARRMFYPAVHSGTQRYTAAHSGTQRYTAVHSGTQRYTAAHSGSQRHTAVHSGTQLPQTGQRLSLLPAGPQLI